MKTICLTIGMTGLLTVAICTVKIFTMFYGQFYLTDFLLGALIWAVFSVGFVVAGLYDK